MSARIKLLFDNTFGDKTLSIIHTNCIAKLLKTKNCQNDGKDRCEQYVRIGAKEKEALKRPEIAEFLK
jgi:hypothetical protein